MLLTADTGRLSGEVVVDGRAGLLLQDPADAVVAGRVGRDVAFGPENVGLDRAEIWDRVAGSLAAVEFPYAAGHASGSLSGGEGQRLALAGALALHPGLVLLDEPTAMLDPRSADDVRRAVLAAVAATGATLVVVEHRLERWVDEVDRLVVLSASGAVIADGAPREVLSGQAESLAAQGVWVPGRRAPEPLVFDDGLAGPWREEPPTGAACLTAEGVTVAGRLAETSVTLRADHVVAVTGVSGAGKSTLLAALAGLQRVSSGHVRAEAVVAGGLGPDPGRWPSPELARRVGWAGQHPEQGFVARTVREEVLAGLRGDVDDPDRPTPAARARADGLLAALGLTALASVDPYRLSGGEQRRVAVAAALAQGPQVLLLDEPTLGQDRLTWAAVSGAIRAARDAGTAVAVATHDRLLVDQLAATELPLARTPGGLPGAERAGPGRDIGRATRGARPAGPERGWPPAARCGPLAGLLVSAFAVAGSVFVRSLPVALVAVGLELLLSPLAVSSLRAAALRILPGLVAALSVGWSAWLLGGHDLATGVTASLRIVFLVLPGALLTAHLDPSRLGDDLAQRLHLPARPVVATVAALQRLEDLGAVWSQAGWARKVRGLGAGRSPLARLREAAALTFVLLVQTVRRSGRMAVAMDARGFADARARTWAEPSRWSFADTVLVVLGLAVAAVPLVLSRR